MLRLESGIVRQVLQKRQGMQILELYLPETGLIENAVSYSEEQYEEGEELLMNTTAIRLQLGTGGYHIVVGKRSEKNVVDVYPSTWGHVMKMRYSPWQMAVDAVEEQHSPYHQLFSNERASLEGTPVLIGELHSLLPAVASAVKQAASEVRAVYVMPDGASLPIALSHQADHLKRTGLLSGTITTGHAWGGDWESVSIHNGLLAARHVARADIILCILGPGVAGTATPFGFSGMQLAEVIHAVSLLGGVPFFIPRISFSDPRERHLGVSHHTITVLKRFALRPVFVPVPVWDDERDERIARQMEGICQQTDHMLMHAAAPDEAILERLECLHELHFSTMGRSWRQDPTPFQTAVLAGMLAAKSIPCIKDFFTGEAGWSAGRDILAKLGLFLTRTEG
ncbi:DUF3866 family protein [Brevibacillus borstelensis]|uniref:DUF3866 family protein n=1 Tax=Brevibacillus borstelensis TaxID=45462 RepID=UPI0030C5C98F